MQYEGRVFRPPSEAYSLIVQSTIGCSHNKCAFCDMYKEKQYRVRPLDDVLRDLIESSRRPAKKIFIADGDALMRPVGDWLAILECIHMHYSGVRSITTYASPRSILLKRPDELALLRENGLSMVYMGLESGSEAVLQKMCKGATATQIIEAGRRVKSAGIKLSVTAISGLGGVQQWKEHAVETASAFTQMKPDYIGLLTLMVEPAAPLYSWIKDGSFTPLSPQLVFEETLLMLENIDAEGAVFRSNHASNYLSLAGTLNTDKPQLISALRQAIAGEIKAKPEEFRLL